MHDNVDKPILSSIPIKTPVYVVKFRESTVDGGSARLEFNQLADSFSFFS